MRSLFSNFFLVTLFACLSVQYASCIRCYECGLEECDDAQKLSSSMIRECPDDSRSVCFKGEFKSYGEKLTVRQCGIAHKQRVGEKLEMEEFEGRSGDVYACISDLCNGAEGVIPSTSMILFISAVLSIYFSCT